MTSEASRIATVGMFDGVHLGHCSLLSELRRLGQERGLTPAVFTFDRHPLQIICPDKAPASLSPIAERVKRLHDAGVTDVVILTFDNELRALDARSFITMLHDRYGVRAILMGFNHRFGSDRLKDFADYAAIGRELGVEILRGEEWSSGNGAQSVSSSSVRRALGEGDMALAADMLGRPYSISGKVVGGREIGRKIGFPTANITPAEATCQLPAPGVYAVDVTMPDGTVRRGMLNIGVRPTVDHSANPALTIEVNIIDWDGDLYGKTLTLTFISRLRGEMRFADLDSLRTQLTHDREAALLAK